MQKLNPILLAEDSTNDAELTISAFKELQLSNRIDVVRNGAEAMDYLRYHGSFSDRPKEKPAFILLDNKMPKMSGVEVLKAVKQDPVLKTIPVVMLTSSSLEDDVLTCYKLGANGYVVKPVNFETFLDSVKSLGSFWARVNRAPKN